MAVSVCFCTLPNTIMRQHNDSYIGTKIIVQFPTWPHSSMFSTFNFSLPFVASGNGLAFVRIWLRVGRFSDCPEMFCRCHMPSKVCQTTICDGKFGWAYFTKHITVSFILLFSNEWILFLKWFVKIARSSLHFGHFESVIRWIYPINSCDLLFR